MKKFASLVLISLMMVMPMAVKADEVKENKFDIVFKDDAKSEKDVNGSLIYGGSKVLFDKQANGIGFLLGNDVKFKGNLDYAVMAGNVVSVDGIVENDAFIFGNTIELSKDFQAKRDITIFGNLVTLRGNITRDVIIYGSTVVIEDAVIDSNVTIHATNIEIKENVKINKALGYNQDAKISIDEDATISTTNLLEKMYKENTFKDIVVTFIMQYASMLLIFLVFALLTPVLLKKIENRTDKFSLFQLFVMIGFGALGLVILPILLALLGTLIFGLPLALILLVLYIIVIYLTPIFSGYVIGSVLFKKVFKKETSPLLVGLVGITITMLLCSIPVIGIFMTLLSLLLGIGTVGYLFKKD